jgi:short-subunit dehydrogenase
MQLEGKSVLITGAGSGIGRALALDAAARGARLILSGRRQAALNDTVALMPGEVSCAIVPGDVTGPQVRLALAHVAEQKFSGLDILVNNAGTLSTGPLSALDDDALAAMVRTNLFAPAALTRDCLPLLRRSRGRVVNIGSMFGDISYPLFSLYSATKFGLRGLSDALRRELAPDGIGVTYVAPRGTRTESVPEFSRLIEPFGMKLDPPERVARQTWDAVERDARSVYPRGMERLFVLLQRLVPGLIDAGLARQLSRAESAHLSRRADPTPSE